MTTARRLRRLAAAGLVTIEGRSRGFHDAETWGATLHRIGHRPLVVRAATHATAIRELVAELDRHEARGR